MKFSCERNVLLTQISFAQEIISTKNAISILSNVLLEAAGDTLTIKATDIKVAFTTSIKVDVSEGGSLTVFCDKLLSILGSIPEGAIEIEENEGKIVIKPLGGVKKIRFQLKSIESDKFPEFPQEAGAKNFDIPVKEMKRMISQTVFAVSDDETRYYMNGVYIEKKEDTIVMVSTDGRRLACIQKVVKGVPDFKGVIVPPKILNLIMKRAGEQGPVNIAVSERNLYVKFDNYNLSSALIEGQFPNYQRVIPESQQQAAKVVRSDLLEALKRVSLLVEQKSRRVFLQFAPGSVAINSEESDIGAAREEISCEYEGPTMSIALNYKYLEEPLKVMDVDKIIIEFTEPNKAMTIQADPVQDYFHVVMPMQVD